MPYRKQWLPSVQSPLLPASLPPVFPPSHCSFCLERRLFTSIGDDLLSSKRSTFLSSPARHLKHTEKGRNQKVERSERAGGRTAWCKKAPWALTPQPAEDDSASCLFSPLSTACERKKFGWVKVSCFLYTNYLISTSFVEVYFSLKYCPMIIGHFILLAKSLHPKPVVKLPSDSLPTSVSRMGIATETIPNVLHLECWPQRWLLVIGTQDKADWASILILQFHDTEAN